MLDEVAIALRTCVQSMNHISLNKKGRCCSSRCWAQSPTQQCKHIVYSKYSVKHTFSFNGKVCYSYFVRKTVCILLSDVLQSAVLLSVSTHTQISELHKQGTQYYEHQQKHLKWSLGTKIASSTVSILLDYLVYSCKNTNCRRRKFRGYCGWAVTDLQAKVHEVDQDSQTLQDHL